MTKENRMIEVAAEASYNTHWGRQKSGGYPPCWVDVSEETKEFIRAQMRNVIKAVDRYREQEENPR